MTDLVEFLRARLDEDERAAIATLKPEVIIGSHRGKPIPRWAVHGSGRGLIDEDGGTVRAKDIFPAEAEHVARHDPARVLREVEAKRQIIKRYEQQAAKQYENAAEEDRTWTLEPVLYDLALPYADHPDYRQEWRP